MCNHSTKQSRRSFLAHAGGLAGMGISAPFAINLAAMGSAAAQTASDYKALVCLFMYGGNDAFNTVLATDPTSWQRYAAVRPSTLGNIGLLKDAPADRTKTAGSAQWLGGVLPISPLTAQSGRTFALHPMLSDVQSMFGSKRLAVIANVGSLIEPVTRTQYIGKSRPTPKKLFSHNDQQSTWQTFSAEGASTGWGGKIGDIFAGANGNSLFTCVSAGDGAAWLSGRTVKQYRMGPNGAVRLGTKAGATDGLPYTYSSRAVGEALQNIVRTARTGHVMEADYTTVAARSILAEQQISKVLPSAANAPFGPSTLLQFTPPGGAPQINPLASQLQMVARTIAAQGSLGVKRQVFFVNLGGFDTHANQALRHATLMAQLNHALKYFDGVVSAMGMADQVTTFTASDFGRTFTGNGDGTDHGWGGHHFVMGGAVAGGDIYGQFPVYGEKAPSNNDMLGSEDQIYNGTLVPRLSIDQYGATLANWFGVPSSALNDIFPHASNFASRLNLSFMRT